MLLCLIAFCSAAQATNLLITVQDSLDNTTVPHATVYLSGANVGMTNNAGQFLLNSGQGDLNLRISMDGYDDWASTVSGNTTSLLVSLNRRTLNLNVALYDSNSLQSVSGATLYLTSANSTQVKTSDASGAASFGVTAYTYYTLNITAPNYQPRSETIDVANKDQNVQYWLLSGNQYSFVVKDKNSLAAVADASISVNSVLLGKTDSRGILIAPISRDTPVTIEVQKTGYQMVTQVKTISTNEAVDAVLLSPEPVSAFVFVYDQKNQSINGADVYVNDTVQGTTNPYGRATLQNLVPGNYIFVVKKTGYTPASQQVTLSNDSSEFQMVLSLATVSQTLFVQDTDQKNLAGATVLLNGVVAGTTDSHGQLDTQLTYDTPYNITVTDDGYRPLSVQQNVPLGNTTTPLTITLEKNMDWGFVTLIGVGILVLLILYAVIRLFVRRSRHHATKRNEI
ncbi:MAG: carboxypeptidase regulatory-like domain-containing protein [Methanoregula sp.]|uniref:carboxypeptidase regulatory-like domain-containing protein n=1 Tax=Methanoregula sp. TaxID=2052170 RepID=UPI003D0F9D0F